MCGRAWAQPLQEVRTQKDLEGITTDFRQAVEMTKDDREWRDVEQTPEYQAWEREQGCAHPRASADELGWQIKLAASMRSKTPPASGTGRICITERPVPTAAIDLAEQEMRHSANGRWSCRQNTARARTTADRGGGAIKVQQMWTF